MKKIVSAFCMLFSLTAAAQNVGIGETAPNETRLQVKRADSALMLLHNSSSGTDVKTGLFFKNGSSYSGSIITTGNTGAQTFRMGFSTFGAPSPSGLIERISILDGGNVGIGTTSPTAKLEVNGSLKLTGGSPGAGKFLISDNTGLASWYDLSPTLLPVGASGNTLRNNGSGWLATSNLYNDGYRIGIGTTTPGSLLEIKAATGTADIELNASTGDNAILRLNKNGASNYSTLRFKTSGTVNWDLGMNGSDHFKLQYTPTNFTILDVDNVTRNLGIFTNDFTEDVNIGGNTAIAGAVISKNSNAGFQFYDRTNNAYGGWNWYADGGKANLFRYGGLGNALTIDATGKLGIAVASPTSPLSFPATIGKKISLYPGSTGDAGFGVFGNELRINADYNGADITFGYDNYTNGFTENMRVKGNGNVGIGTNNPAAKMEIRASTGDGLFVTSPSQTVRVSTGALGALLGSVSNGNTNLVANDIIGATLKPDGSFGLGTVNPAYKLDVNGRMRLRHNGVTSGLWFNNSSNTEASFIGQYTDNLLGIYGNAWQFAVNRNDGTVYLGSSNLDAENLALGAGYKLRVFGKIIGEEVRVQLKTAWPDYVFEKQYKKLSLNELEQFVNENKHLPNIPCAKEIEKDGQHLGEIQIKMLEKIEELSLYIIELNKKMKVLEEKIASTK